MVGDSRLFQDALKRGSAHAWAGRWEKAAEEYRLALEQFPEDVPARTHLAMALYRSGQSRGALELYHGLWKAQPSNLALLQRVAELQEVLGERTAAVESYLVVAEVHRRRRSIAEALKAWRKVVELKPGDPELWDRLMEVAAEAGPPKDLIPGYLEVARNLAAAGRFKDAIRMAERARILDPTNPAVPQLLSGIRPGLEYSLRSAEMGEAAAPEDLQRLIPPMRLFESPDLTREPPVVATPPVAAVLAGPDREDIRHASSPPASLEAATAPVPAATWSEGPSLSPGSVSVDENLAAVPVEEVPTAAPAKEEPMGAAVEEEQPAAVVDEDAPIVSTEVVLTAASLEEEPPVALVEDEPEVVSVEEEPVSVSVEEEPVAVFVGGEPAVDSVVSVDEEPPVVPLEAEPPVVSGDAEPAGVSPQDEPNPVSLEEETPIVSVGVEPSAVDFEEEPPTVAVGEDLSAVAVEEEPTAVFVEEEPSSVPVEGELAPTGDVEVLEEEETPAHALPDTGEAEIGETEVAELEQSSAAVIEEDSAETPVEGVLEYVGSAQVEAVELDQETAPEGAEQAQTAAWELAGGTTIAEELVKQAESHERLGRTEEAAVAYEQALGLAPDLARAYVGMARLCLVHSRLDRAEEEARTALQACAPTDSERASAAELLVAVCTERASGGDLVGAASGLAWLRSSADADRIPSSLVESIAVESVELLGQCVGEHLEEVSQLPLDARQEVLLGLGRGEGHLRAGLLRSAADEMYRLVLAYPDFLPPQSVLGRILVAEGRLEDARERSQRLLELYQVRGAPWQSLEVLWWTVAQGVGNGDARAELVRLLRDQRRFGDAGLVGSEEWGARPTVVEPPTFDQRGAADGAGADWTPGVSFRIVEPLGDAGQQPPEERGLSFEERLRVMLGIGEPVLEGPAAAEALRDEPAEGDALRGQTVEPVTSQGEATAVGSVDVETRLDAIEMEAPEAETGGETAERDAPDADVQEATPEVQAAEVEGPSEESIAADAGVEPRPWDSLLQSAEAGFASGDLEGAAALVLEALQSDRIADDATWAALVRVLQLLGRDDVRKDLVDALRQLRLPEELADR